MKQDISKAQKIGANTQDNLLINQSNSKTMPQDEEKKEALIQSIVNLLRTTPFACEFKVTKNPKGIKIIYEVTQEQMDVLARKMAKVNL